MLKRMTLYTSTEDGMVGYGAVQLRFKSLVHTDLFHK